MNNRSYVYDTVIAPDSSDDSIKPFDLLTSFASSNTPKLMLKQFLSAYDPTYVSSVREIILAKPRIRSAIRLIEVSHDKVTLSVGFWEQAYVYSSIIATTNISLLSQQIISGVDNNNTALKSQQHVATQTD